MHSGLRLEEQRVDDMFDILHYLFESDTLGEEEMQKAKAKMRQQVYKLLYLRDYTWMVGDSDYRDFGTQEAGAVGQRSNEIKPYIPPTPVNAGAPNPYGSVLDAPLG